jgi:putative oxidoreductase
MKLGSLVLRGAIGPFFIGHGTQKLFGWFGGHGPEGTAGFMESLGMRPGRRHAALSGWAETLGGAGILLGALTPLASSAITATMVTAIRKVHAGKGPWVTEGGYEYNVVTIAALMALTADGPGHPSVDATRFPRMKGSAWALLALGAGVAGSYVATSESANAAADQAVEKVVETVPGLGEDEPRFSREPDAETASMDR